ncbi:MAG: hypothetical protein V3U80_03460 [Flavobacteriaceae bacterium]
MSKLILILTFILSLQTVIAQNNNIDTNEKRHGIWKKTYKSGNIRYQGEFNHGKEIGIFKFYKNVASSKPYIIKEYNNSNTEAIVKFYSSKGVLETLGSMNGKNRIGRWEYYHKDGITIRIIENYLNGKLNGKYTSFYENKKPSIEAHYKNGKLDGLYKRYAVLGHVYQELTYSNGTLNGKAIYHDRESGDIIKSGQYINDEKVGTWQIYIDGIASETKEIKPYLKKNK